QLESKSRSPRVAHARQLAMYLASDLTGASTAAIAREFHRDHTTVLHALRAVSSRLEPGAPTLEALHSARRELGMTADQSGVPLPDLAGHPPAPSTPDPDARGAIPERRPTPSTTSIH